MVLSVHIFKPHFFVLYQLSQVMILDLNMFCLSMHHMILWNVYSTCIVTIDYYRISNLFLHTFQQLLDPNNFRTIYYCNNILSIYYGLRDVVLLLACPCNQSLSNKESASTSAFLSSKLLIDGTVNKITRYWEGGESKS
jgi:hypothetical protein